MIIDQEYLNSTTNRFECTIQLSKEDLKPLHIQAYKDKISVQYLISRWIDSALDDLMLFCQESEVQDNE